MQDSIIDMATSTEEDLCELRNLNQRQFSHISQTTTTWWYERKVLVREVFYVQTCLIFTVVIGSIINIIQDTEDKQVWTVLLSTAIGHFLPAPGGGKSPSPSREAENNIETTSVTKNVFTSSWNRRTLQARELFYARAILVFAIVITSIVNLSIGVGDSQVWTVLLSASFANMLPSPKLSKKLYRNNTN